MALTRKFYTDLGKGIRTRRQVAAWLEKNANNQWGWSDDHLDGITTCCSGVELSGVTTVNDAQVGIATALEQGDKNVMYYCTSPTIEKALKSWGFKEIAGWPGNHGRRVKVLFNRIGGRAQ
jgi:hypothetical protein